MSSSLASALNWYHNKIGAYDKQSWEKNVDQRILRGVSAIPKKTARIKTELIDVDLVRGSAFPKAKPQHSWIAATLSGIQRVFLLPFFYTWWKIQTNSLVSKVLVALYVLQIIAMVLYFSAEEKEFQGVSVSEVLAPMAMMVILGVVHSQIVATFASKKTHKRITRTKRKRIKNKRHKRFIQCHESKSSPDSASEDKLESQENRPPSPSTNDSCDDQNSNTGEQTETICTDESCLKCHACDKKTFKSGQHLRFAADNSKNHSNSESGLDDPDFVEPSEECDIKKNSCDTDDINSHISNCVHSTEKKISFKLKNSNQNCRKSKDSLLQTSLEQDDVNVSSGEEYFVAKKPSFSLEQWKNYIFDIKNGYNFYKGRSSKKNCLKKLHTSFRRYSDFGLSYGYPKSSSVPLLRQSSHRYSEDNILSNGDATSAKFLPTDKVESVNGSENDNNCLYERPSLSIKKISVNTKKFSSSCESGADTTSPTTPSKPVTSDLEWPLITNTDCNSDSSDCSQENGSNISPSENPFAWEIQEPSTKFLNVGYASSDKVSCTIWERNECKKVDLTVLDISSAIIRKVDSSYHSTEYLYIGVFFSLLLSFLPLLFRIQNGVTMDVIQDVTSDVLQLTVPSSDEVVKITDALVEIMLGSHWRIKAVVLIVMLERFTLSFAYFFLLSVAEKTFKQRFLYAKHFCHLTSSRRARRSDLPHFRLNKVRNIKTWLSIRSYLKKLGPQRSVDVIVSIAFILEVCVVSFLCIQLLKETGQFSDKLYSWELLYWTLALGIFLLRFMVIGSKINMKYRNLSVLITEQINLYLHMEQKPHKKEELMLANNVLKLAADLLKELESPFKISGLCANSYLYNITKVVVLSAFSAVLTDVLGFKLKLYKIKMK